MPVNVEQTTVFNWLMMMMMMMMDELTLAWHESEDCKDT